MYHALPEVTTMFGHLHQHVDCRKLESRVDGDTNGRNV